MAVARRKRKGSFEIPVDGSFDKPGPVVDLDGQAISTILSGINKRALTGFVINWLPPWAKKAGVESFGFFFFEDKLAADSFNRDVQEVDIERGQTSFTQAQWAQIEKKREACQKRGIAYLALGPEDDIDPVNIGALLGKTKYRKPEAVA